MKCYRVYFENDCLGTFFSIAQAINFQVIWTEANIETRIEIEKYNY